MQVLSGRHEPEQCGAAGARYSSAWLHHKGRNKHHLEYWIDYGVPEQGGDRTTRRGMCGMRMPVRYVVEMYIDRVAASKNYQKERYTDRSALEYYIRGRDVHMLHEDTQALLELLLYMLAARGEGYVNWFIRKKLLRGEIPYERSVLERMCERYKK